MVDSRFSCSHLNKYDLFFDAVEPYGVYIKVVFGDVVIKDEELDLLLRISIINNNM
jgi:hypothetical protein